MGVRPRSAPGQGRGSWPGTSCVTRARGSGKPAGNGEGLRHGGRPWHFQERRGARWLVAGGQRGAGRVGGLGGRVPGEGRHRRRCGFRPNWALVRAGAWVPEGPGAAARQTVDVESVGSAAGRGVRGEGHVVEDRGEVGPATGGGWAPGWAVLRPRRHMGTSCASVRAERRAWGPGPADTGNVSPPWGGHRERRRGVPGVPELVTLGEVGRASQVDSQVRRGRRAGPWGGCVRGMSGER